MPTKRYHGYHKITPEQRELMVYQFIEFDWDIDFIALVNDVDSRCVRNYISRVICHNTVLSRAEIEGNKGGRPSSVTLYVSFQ